jgi:hypothetical protein
MFEGEPAQPFLYLSGLSARIAGNLLQILVCILSTDFSVNPDRSKMLADLPESL